MAIPPRPRAQTPAAGVNSQLNVSAGGREAIETRERVVSHYYNDQASNCTYGVGQLAHMGPCTPQEMHTPVPPAMIRNSMDHSINHFADMVRRGVPTRTLTQNQFDALASYAYNAPYHTAQSVLRDAEAGNDAAVTSTINTTTYIHRHDAQGRTVGGAVYSRGLANRRQGEVEQYGRQ